MASQDLQAPLLSKRLFSEVEDDDNDGYLFMPEEMDISSDNVGDQASPNAGDDEEEVGDSDGEMEGAILEPLVHNEKLESYPKCAIYDDTVPVIQSRFFGLAQQALDVFQDHDSQSRQVLTQQANARACLRVSGAKKPRIAVLGNAGTGKSSFINSITDIDDIAKSLSGGASCTCVPVEYQDSINGQKLDFAAKISYYDLDKIREMLTEIMEDYKTAVFEPDEEWDEDTRLVYKQRAENAFKILRTLFRDDIIAGSAADARKFLQKCYDEQNETIIDRMIDVCTAKLSRMLQRGSYVEWRQSTTSAGLRRMIDPLMTSPTNAEESSLWPLVERVTIGARGPRVLEQVTLVDLPGISDTNKLRVNSTIDYIKSCDEIWVVAPIARIADDVTVSSLVIRYGKLFKGRVVVVATRIDDNVDTKLVKHLKDEGYDMQYHEELTKLWKAKKKEVTKLSRTLKKLKDRPRSKKLKRDLDEIIDIESNQLPTLKTEWKQIEEQRFNFVVETRNNLVKLSLQDEFGRYLPQGHILRVFCISNSHYAALKGADSVKGVRLHADATGIPALRAYALGIAAPAQMRKFEEHGTIKVKAFLQGLELWITKPQIEHRHELLHIVFQPQANLAGRLDSRVKDFLENLSTTVSTPLASKRDQARTHAVKVLGQKRDKHHATIRAFIRKNGVHKAKMCPRECWNEQFCKVSKDLAVQQIGVLEADNTVKTQELENGLVGDLKTLLRTIASQQVAVNLPMGQFEEIIDTRIQAVHRVFENNTEEYNRDIRNTLIDITQDSHTNYFSQGMRPGYNACNMETGKGMTKRRLQLLEDHLSLRGSSSPFVKMETGTIKAFTKHADKHVMDKIGVSVGKVFSDIYKTFDEMIDEKIEDPGEAALRTMFGGMLGKLKEEYEQILADLAAVKSKYEK